MRAVKAKYEGGPPLTREDWEDLLGHCMVSYLLRRLLHLLRTAKAVADLPCYLFASELTQLYPNAKVILSVRDSPEVWRASMLKTTVPTGRAAQPTSPVIKLLSLLSARIPVAPIFKKLVTYARVLDVEWDGIRIYEDHNAFVRRLVSPDQLLEFNVKDGWKPLCKFLGHSVPKEPFPKVNDEETYKVEMAKAFQRQGSVVVRRLMGIIVACFVLVAAVLLQTRRSSR